MRRSSHRAGLRTAAGGGEAGRGLGHNPGVQTWCRDERRRASTMWLMARLKIWQVKGMERVLALWQGQQDLQRSGGGRILSRCPVEVACRDGFSGLLKGLDEKRQRESAKCYLC